MELQDDQLTVKDLIQKLKELPPTARIWAWGYEGCSKAKVVGVFFDKKGVTSKVFIDAK